MKSHLRSIVSLVFLFTMAACGGGGSLSQDNSSGGGGTPTPTINVNVEVTNTDGSAAGTLSSNNELKVTATVTNSNGDKIANTLVTFSLTPDNLAVFNNSAGTASTNAEGVATIGLKVGANSGAGEVIATLSTNETAKTTFTSAGTTPVSQTPASLELYASAVQLASSGSDKVELIALVKNDQNVLMEGVDVSFSVNADASLQVTQGKSAADGTARAMLSTQNNPENRIITATASTADLNKALQVQVVGTQVNINGPASITVNDSVELTVLLQDSDGKPIANQTLNVQSKLGTLNNNAPVTSGNGQATLTYSATTSGRDTITASGLNARVEFAIVVQQDEFSFTKVPASDIPLGQSSEIQVTWKKDGTPFANGNVTFTLSRGQIDGNSSTTTDASGVATLKVKSSNAGRASITATGTDGDGKQVTATQQIEFVATQPSNVFVDASPDILGPDGQTSTITAIVRDADGNLVKGARVAFNVNDVSNGSISPSESTTNSNGVASSVFTSGSVSSKDKVVITATILDIADTVEGTVNLTVGARAFDISVGTGNLIQSPDNASYLKEFSVFVSDSVGRPVANVQLTASVAPDSGSNTAYRKGEWVWNSTIDIWQARLVTIETDVNGNNQIVLKSPHECTNEDANNNGILDPNEDRNGDTFLTPGIVGTIGFKNGVSTTDANGQAILELRYPREYAAWYDSVISVFSESTGSEASASTRFRYTASAADLKNEAAQPPNSPFGTSNSCDNTN